MWKGLGAAGERSRRTQPAGDGRAVELCPVQGGGLATRVDRHAVDVTDGEPPAAAHVPGPSPHRQRGDVLRGGKHEPFDGVSGGGRAVDGGPYDRGGLRVVDPTGVQVGQGVGSLVAQMLPGTQQGGRIGVGDVRPLPVRWPGTGGSRDNSRTTPRCPDCCACRWGSSRSRATTVESTVSAHPGSAGDGRVDRRQTTVVATDHWPMPGCRRHPVRPGSQQCGQPRSGSGVIDL